MAPCDKRARARSILARPIAETLKEQQEVVRLTRREEREHLSPESILNLSLTLGFRVARHCGNFAFGQCKAYWASET